MKLDKKFMIMLLMSALILVAGYFTWQYFHQSNNQKISHKLPTIQGEMTFKDTFKLDSSSLEQAYQRMRSQHVTPETAAFLRNSLPTQNADDFFDDETYIAASYQHKSASEVTVTVFWQGGQDVHEMKLKGDEAQLTITNYAD